MLAARSSFADHYVVPSGRWSARSFRATASWWTSGPMACDSLHAGKGHLRRIRRAGRCDRLRRADDGRADQARRGGGGDRSKCATATFSSTACGATRERPRTAPGRGPDVAPFACPRPRVRDGRLPRNSRTAGIRLREGDRIYAKAAGVYFRSGEGFVWNRCDVPAGAGDEACGVAPAGPMYAARPAMHTGRQDDMNPIRIVAIVLIVAGALGLATGVSATRRRP